MSDIIFENIKLKVDVDDSVPSFMRTILAYAIPKAAEEIQSYWRKDAAEKIINESSFGFLWNEFPEHREVLVAMAETSLCGDNPNSLSKEYSRDFIKSLYSSIEESDDIAHHRFKARFVRLLNPGFDYLEQVCKYSLNEDTLDVLNVWVNTGMDSSSDPAFFDYLWSKVKHEKGAVDEKESIVHAAHKNGALSDDLIGKIAKSSPKRIKRMVANILSNDITTKRWFIKSRAEDCPLRLLAEKEVVKLESGAMLFVSCDDSRVVSSLLDCLSRDNLPWLMPSASKHTYLASRLYRLTTEDN